MEDGRRNRSVPRLVWRQIWVTAAREERKTHGNKQQVCWRRSMTTSGSESGQREEITQDRRGWDVFAPVYVRVGDSSKSQMKRFGRECNTSASGVSDVDDRFTDLDVETPFAPVGGTLWHCLKESVSSLPVEAFHVLICSLSLFLVSPTLELRNKTRHVC